MSLQLTEIRLDQNKAKIMPLDTNQIRLELLRDSQVRRTMCPIKMTPSTLLEELKVSVVIAKSLELRVVVDN